MGWKWEDGRRISEKLAAIWGELKAKVGGYMK